jgi:hypothetical protein
MRHFHLEWGCVACDWEKYGCVHRLWIPQCTSTGNSTAQNRRCIVIYTECNQWNTVVEAESFRLVLCAYWLCSARGILQTSSHRLIDRHRSRFRWTISAIPDGLSRASWIIHERSGRTRLTVQDTWRRCACLPVWVSNHLVASSVLRVIHYPSLDPCWPRETRQFRCKLSTIHEEPP